MPGDPSSKALVEAMEECLFDSSVLNICVTLSRRELLMSAALRGVEYQQTTHKLQATKWPITVTTPLLYPGIEGQAIKATIMLCALCKMGGIELLEPSKQFLIGRQARRELFIDESSLSLHGARHVAIFLKERSNLPFPLLVANGGVDS